MSVFSRWRNRLRIRRGLEKSARRRYIWHPTRKNRGTLTTRRKQVAVAERVVRRHRHDTTSGPAKALREARKYTGRTESPAGSNTAPWGLGAWIKELLGLNYGVAWCGVYVWRCLDVAGVKGLTGRVAAVRYIYEDAGAGRNGFEKRVPLSQARPGDVAILFGTSTHTGLLEKRVPGGWICREGNTSSGVSGSQSDGGGAFRRTRPNSAIVAVCRPRY